MLTKLQPARPSSSRSTALGWRTRPPAGWSRDVTLPTRDQVSRPDALALRHGQGGPILARLRGIGGSRAPRTGEGRDRTRSTSRSRTTRTNGLASGPPTRWRGTATRCRHATHGNTQRLQATPRCAMPKATRQGRFPVYEIGGGKLPHMRRWRRRPASDIVLCPRS